ncbi:MAG: hypothetical protein JWR16_3310 [Nevskia sp.]|nr:hypothetical protein [Nevskia sp.]
MNNPINTIVVVDEAIFKILRCEEVRVGGWIRLSTIGRYWLLTGLRRADLAEGLARLDTRGYLYLKGGDDDSFAIVRKRPPFFRRRTLKALRLLNRAKLRPRNGSPATDRRSTPLFPGDYSGNR